MTVLCENCEMCHVPECLKEVEHPLVVGGDPEPPQKRNWRRSGEIETQKWQTGDSQRLPALSASYRSDCDVAGIGADHRSSFLITDVSSLASASFSSLIVKFWAQCLANIFPLK